MGLKIKGGKWRMGGKAEAGLRVGGMMGKRDGGWEDVVRSASRLGFAWVFLRKP
jgi:hypothetical protein